VQTAVVRSLGQLNYSKVPDEIIRVRFAAAESLGRLGQTATEIRKVQLEALSKADNSSLRSNIAHLLGQFGQSDETTVEALCKGLLDANKNVCIACAQALAKLGLSYPKILETIESKLVQTIKDPKFDRLDSPMDYPANDYAYDALWLLEVGGEIEEV
jgi:HEAT repeat protein